MPNDKVRLSQIVGIFGPGSMLDLPDRSVLVQGLDHWGDVWGRARSTLLRNPVCRGSCISDFPMTAASLAIGRPNSAHRRSMQGIRGVPSPGIKATVFRRWFACDAIAGDPPNRRRLARFQDLAPPKRLEHLGDDGKRRKASPIRFVCGCENGHLQDIDWRRIVHQNYRGDDAAGSAAPCREHMWQEDAGTSADPRDTRIVCDCGASLSLEELFQPGRLGACPGERPWIGDRDPNTCNAPSGLRLLTRSATNTYFPQVARVISLPQTVDDLARRIEAFWSILEGCASVDEVRMARALQPSPEGEP